MRKTLLEIVQSILNDMDSEDVNSISDTTEAQQIASVVKDTFYNIIATRLIPEHKTTFNITSLSQSARPTHFLYPTDVKVIDKLFYNVSETGAVDYKEVHWVEPLDFFERMPMHNGSTTTIVTDTDDETKIVVSSDAHPTYYTSFDDEHIIMDSYKSSVESILSQSKTKAFGTKFPAFTISDSFEPDLDDVMLPMLLAEAKSTCMSLFKAGSDPKVEQAARRLKTTVQNDLYRTRKENSRPSYGR
jgi:hypothetical protein